MMLNGIDIPSIENFVDARNFLSEYQNERIKMKKEFSIAQSPKYGLTLNNKKKKK